MNLRFHFIILLIFPLFLAGQIQFVANTGQWNSDFSYQSKLKYGALFFEDDGLKVHLFNPHDLNAIYGEETHTLEPNRPEIIHQHAYKQQFLASKKPQIIGLEKASFYNNYFIGNDETKWRGNVPVYSALKYAEIYNGIDIIYKEQDGKLKYNWEIHPGANPKQIKWKYDGADSVWIKNNEIIIQTSIGFVVEQLPAVYTKNKNTQIPVVASFLITGKELSFKLGKYADSDTLIIDPIIVFSSFSGSLADNWGFTATYDDQGNLYGGGIAMAAGYPTTTGAFQTSHSNPSQNALDLGVECTITKFNAQGTGLIYSTYLGGNGQDQPHSMFVDAAGDLYVFGVTGSSNFPVSTTAFQKTFAGGDSVLLDGYTFSKGTDIFVAKFNPSGSALAASTYIGGTANDGLNWNMASNYGDQSRGEIVIGDDNMVYITASTLSDDFPVVNPAQSVLGGAQDAVIVKLNSSLSALSWSTYYGGTAEDAGYGIKLGSNGSVYICGGTTGSVLAGTTGKYLSSYQGGSRDGYIAQFNKNTGAILGATYVGTNNYDQTFLIDLDKFNNVFVFGQTRGNYPVSPNVYFNNAGKQFIHKFNTDLTASVFSTIFGRGSSSIDIVPTALNVDDCLNILLSGWGGQTNATYLGGTTSNLSVTPDAYQKTTDGSDFYLMVLGPNADSLKYATFFGGSTSQEHVDGGTSRFDDNGIIYQAVCAGCGGYSDFPTTPGAWSNTNQSLQPGPNCNLSVFKINFETSITAIAIIDTNIAIDTNCNTLTLALLNTSKNANMFEWDFGNGTKSLAKNPTVSFTSLGTYTIKLVALDTICDIKDSIEIVVEHDKGVRPRANFTTKYTSCDVFKTVAITNTTAKANKYLWNFGDGQTSTLVNPIHNYASNGTFTITLIATDTTCGASDTATAIVDFSNNIPAPVVLITPDTCFYGGITVRYVNDSAWYTYEWNFNGVIDRNKYPAYRFLNAGRYVFSLTIEDTICNVKYTFPFIEDIQRIEDRVYIPNAFTPNRDNINEDFIIAGNECVGHATFQILSSYGTIMFETDKPFTDFWNGYVDGKPAQEDVYTYVFKSDDFEKRGYITVFY